MAYDDYVCCGSGDYGCDIFVTTVRNGDIKMLDRKTKNIDASMELLLDRDKQCNLQFGLLYIIGAIIFFTGFSLYLVTGYVGFPILIALLGLFVLIGSFLILIYQWNLSVIILLKRNEKGEK